jgi:hypothetical protein
MFTRPRRRSSCACSSTRRLGARCPFLSKLAFWSVIDRELERKIWVGLGVLAVLTLSIYLSSRVLWYPTQAVFWLEWDTTALLDISARCLTRLLWGGVPRLRAALSE